MAINPVSTCNSCNIGTSDLPDMYCMPKARGPQARGLRAYILGKSLVPMLQLICNITPGELKSEN